MRLFDVVMQATREGRNPVDVIETATPACCGTCARGFYDRKTGFVICGAPVDDEALRDKEGINPVWAERKYGRSTILALLAGVDRTGYEYYKMPFDDGSECKMWEHA